MVRLINCPKCGRNGVIHCAFGLCRKCYEPPKERCIECGELRTIHKRKENNDPVCIKCYEAPKYKCIKCDKIKKIHKKVGDEGGICFECYRKKYQQREEICVLCGEKSEPYKRDEYGNSVCKKCYMKKYERPVEICSICDKLKEVHKRNENGKALCYNCYILNKLENNEKFLIITRLRTRVKDAFNKYTKTGKIMKSSDYGIDYQAVFEYLGPCPGARKDYHIDHVFPLSAFDLNNPTHIIASFAPENHQWLKKEKNLSKSNKYDVEEFEKYLSRFL